MAPRRVPRLQTGRTPSQPGARSAKGEDTPNQEGGRSGGRHRPSQEARNPAREPGMADPRARRPRAEELARRRDPSTTQAKTRESSRRSLYRNGRKRRWRRWPEERHGKGGGGESVKAEEEEDDEEMRGLISVAFSSSLSPASGPGRLARTWKGLIKGWALQLT